MFRTTVSLRIPLKFRPWRTWGTFPGLRKHSFPAADPRYYEVRTGLSDFVLSDFARRRVVSPHSNSALLSDGRRTIHCARW